MNFLSTLRRSEFLDCPLADSSRRILAGLFPLMLLTAGTCHGYYGHSPKNA